MKCRQKRCHRRDSRWLKKKGYVYPNPNCRRCNQRHHTALCRETKKDDQNKPASSTSGGSTTCFVSLPQEQNVYLKTATVFVHGPKGRLKVTCMIHEGSQRSYVLESASCKSRKSALRRSQYAHSDRRKLPGPPPSRAVSLHWRECILEKGGFKWRL